MIKKSLFEDELIHGMQRELQPYEKKQGMNNLVKAAEYLHSAMDILDEAGLSASADKVLRILGKIALADKKEEDSSKADDNNIGGKKDKDFYEKVMKWIQDPHAPVDPEHIDPGEDIVMESVLAPQKEPVGPGSTLEFTSLQEPKQLPPGEDLVFKSIAQELGLLDNNDAGESKPRHPKNPTKVHSPTSEQMVENLKNHGTVFNMADDGNVDIPQPDTFEEDYKRYMDMLGKNKKKKVTEEDIDPDLVGLIQFDESKVDDLLNLEIDENPVEVMDPALGKTFEDSD